MKEINNLEGIKKKRNFCLYMSLISMVFGYICTLINFDLIAICSFIISVIWVIDIRYWDTKYTMVKMFKEFKK